MLNVINKNLFKLTFIFLVFVELLSFFGWILPEFGAICFFVILLLTLILSLKNLEYGLYILFAELFIGSKGYLFSLEIGDVFVSIRIGLFLIIISVWVYKFIKKYLSNRCHPELSTCHPELSPVPDWNSRAGVSGSRNKFRMTKEFILLGAVILWAFVWGLIQGNNFGNVFLDFNNWLYFLLIFPVLDVAKNSRNFIKNILNILIACVIWIFIKSIILLYIFSHQFVWALPEVYKWVRDTLVGEITFAGNGFWRVFIQSQIYSLLLFFILLPKLKDSRFLKNNNLLITYYLLLITFLTTILLSYARSYWVALAITLLLYYWLLWATIPQYCGMKAELSIILLLKIKFLKFIKLNIKILLITLTSFVIIFLVINLPPKIEQGNLANLLGRRATEVEAAASSRINQLKPLLYAIAKHPLIGSGFGTEVTYKSDDPRILGNYTTYAFEWGYLDLVLKFGLVGLGIYLYLIFKILRRLIISNFQFPISKQILNSKPQLLITNYGLRIGFGLALVALLVVNIFSPYLNHPLGIGFVILCSSIIIKEKTPKI